jgi:hypothetical protein
MHIKTMEQRLSDGSSVFDVVFNHGPTVVVWNAVSQEDAEAFAESLRALIAEHTTHHVTQPLVRA